MKYILQVLCFLISYGYVTAAESIYEGECKYVNDSVTHGAMAHLVRVYLEDAIFVPDIAKNPEGKEYTDGFLQTSSTKSYQNVNWNIIGQDHVKPALEEQLKSIKDQLDGSDKCIPYGCKATKCSLKDGGGIDVKVSCAIGNSSAMLSKYLKSHFEDYLNQLHQDLRWDYELAENALNMEFAKARIKEGYLWSRVTKPISRADYYEVYDLVKAIIPTIFTEREKQIIKTYDVRYATTYGCSVQVHRKKLQMEVACLLYATHHPTVEEEQ